MPNWHNALKKRELTFPINDSMRFRACSGDPTLPLYGRIDHRAKTRGCGQRRQLPDRHYGRSVACAIAAARYRSFKPLKSRLYPDFPICRYGRHRLAALIRRRAAAPGRPRRRTRWRRWAFGQRSRPSRRCRSITPTTRRAPPRSRCASTRSSRGIRAGRSAQCAAKRRPNPASWSRTPPSRRLCHTIAWLLVTTGLPRSRSSAVMMGTARIVVQLRK